ncbi:50S ribosomal protein L21 [Pelolinea submarina]|uniref:Large ribosomal subunit protein bL21 n=1 Tax=Pelolinea submarina TaxID=913107 RepID=A0A347ZUG9_9CHLR|nr:50S ribosomal protein L21 [Pelolinea submarina]REG10463.1 large subunit ribosomal protein L21 [Pelolinea submarina]BBB48950.1 large subunit ribosomal protein L21 [Pelolinea submarina]
MLYAIVESGGKQYKAVEGSYIEVDLLPDEVGKKKTFDKVLLLVDDEKVEVGTPYLSNVSVDTTILEHFKGPKIIVFKYRAKERYRVKTGHRQKYTRVMVESIAFAGKTVKPAKVEEPVAKVEKAEKPAAKKAPAAAAKKASSSTAKKPAAKASTAAKPAAKKTTTKPSAAKKPSEKK